MIYSHLYSVIYKYKWQIFGHKKGPPQNNL